MFSRKISSTYPSTLPKFVTSEVETGTLLGKGTYSNVYEITSLCLTQINQNIMQHHIYREYMSKYVHQEKTGDSRYVIKCLRKDVIDNQKLYKEATRDLITEAQILSSISHTNIITIRGHGSLNETEFGTKAPEGYFLILDRIQETLDQRIQKWRLQEKERTSKRFSLPKKFLSSIQRLNCSIPIDRLKVSVDISSALKYLHESNIIHRDLKPGNIGFDARGEIKLFDFDLSKDLSTCVKFSDGTYKLTGGIGTIRYMAPEVAKGQSYNFSADVYSFIILTWELLTLNRAYQNFTKEQLVNDVFYGIHRPKIDYSFPGSLQYLFEDGWSSNLFERPSMNEVLETLAAIT